jgi:hypothetical protein
MRRPGKEEIAARRKGIETGPWTALGKLAVKKLAPESTIISALNRSSSSKVELENLPLSSKDKKKADALKTSLAPHWKRFIRQKHLPLRISLDEALSVFQLYELAVETEYLTVAEIPSDVRTRIVSLLWSKAARTYVESYDFLAVTFLAQRLGVVLDDNVRSLPMIRQNADAQFAAFLAQHRLWYDDERLDGWLYFLDDFVSNNSDIDKHAFYNFLTSRRSKKFETWNQEQLELLDGADRLISLLAELAGSLDPITRASYGAFYAYWMARMFGYELSKTGYARNNDEADWANEIAKCMSSMVPNRSLKQRSSKLQFRRVNDDQISFVEIPNARELIRSRFDVVREFWKETRMSINGTLARKN